jgi:hypothetical protein
MSAIGSVITLSSSPPRVFARSPTPADNTPSSPTLPSPATIFASQRSQRSQNARASQSTGFEWVDKRPDFKTTNAFRGAFNGGFGCSAELVLKEKPSKGNVPIVKRVGDSKTQEVVGREKQKVLGPHSPTRGRQIRQDTGTCTATNREHAGIAV